MPAVHHTIYEYDWVRIAPPVSQNASVMVTSGGNTGIRFRSSTTKPPREDADGYYLPPNSEATQIDYVPGEGLYARCVGHVSTGLWLSDAPSPPISEATLANLTGWASYSDTEFSEENPFFIENRDGWKPIPNNARFVIDDQKPADVDSFLKNGRIVAKAGDAMAVTIRFKAMKSRGSSVPFETAIDIGGVWGRIFEESFEQPRNRSHVRKVNYSFSCYSLDTWEKNGGVPMIRSESYLQVFDISFLIHRLHRAR